VKPRTPIRDFLDALVHPSARRDKATAERHVAFIAPRLCGSLLALGAFPLLLAWHGVPNTVEFLVLAWMILPIAIACFLSRTGRYEAAQGLSALALTCIVTMVAAASGGMNSSTAVWLVLIPLEAALSGSRRAVVVAALLAIGGAGLLAVAGSWFGLGPAVEPSSLVTLGTLSAVIYATGIALGADGLVQSLRLGREEAQALPAFGATDVVTWHGKGGRLLYASENAGAVLGALPADLQDHGLFDRIHVADRPAWLQALSTAAMGETGEIEFRLRRPGEAGFIWIEMRCRPFGKRDGGPGPDVVAVMRDVSARKHRQDGLIAARTEALRANAAKTRLLASMSHELRTPLNAIIGFSNMLQNDSGHPIDSARQREYARIISQSSHHLLAVANSILDMSRLQTGHFELFPEPFRPASVIASSVELLALRAQEAGVTLAVEAPEDLPGMVADRRAVTQILINLVANAISFSHRGGAVTVRAGIDLPEVVFEVTDTGIGMTPADLARIGNPYFRAAGARRQDDAWGATGPGSGVSPGLGSGQGAGLGLSIVRVLVELHGGTLEASSEPSKGTRMAVRLPLDCAGPLKIARMQKRA
jgi:two-component system, cell cycle sensor histidine kinase DivJ